MRQIRTIIQRDGPNNLGLCSDCAGRVSLEVVGDGDGQPGAVGEAALQAAGRGRALRAAGQERRQELQPVCGRNTWQNDWHTCHACSRVLLGPLAPSRVLRCPRACRTHPGCCHSQPLVASGHTPWATTRGWLTATVGIIHRDCSCKPPLLGPARQTARRPRLPGAFRQSVALLSVRTRPCFAPSRVEKNARLTAAAAVTHGGCSC